MSTSHSEFLNHIQKKRNDLNKLVTIAQDIELMMDGLNGIVQLDNISINIPDEIQSFIIPITNNLKDDSTNDIKELIHSFDHRVHESLKDILNKALIEISRDMDNEEIENTSKQLSEIIIAFKKSVHTSIGARILLKQRNIETPPFKFEIPINTIKETIQKLDKKEEILRIKITNKIDNMISEISVFLNDDTVPQTMKECIAKTHALLSTRKEQLLSGDNFSDITIVIDTIELESDITEDSLTIDKKTKIEPIQNEKEKMPENKRNNIIKRIIIWISTPLDIKWKDTKYFEEKE